MDEATTIIDDPNLERFERYYQRLRISISPRYAADKRAFLEKYRCFLGGKTPDHDSAIDFLEGYADRASSTRATYAGYFVSFFKYLDGSEFPIRIRVDRTLPQIIPDREIEALFQAARQKESHFDWTERDVLVLETMDKTGLRLSETAGLPVGDLDFSSDTPLVIARKTKGKVDRAIPLPPLLAGRLRDFVKGRPRDELVFGLTSSGLSCLVTRIALRAGLPHIHPHSLRHHYATTLYHRGVGLLEIQQLLGHKSLSTTQKYLALGPDGLKKAVARLEEPQTPPPAPPAPPPAPAPPAENPELGTIQPFFADKNSSGTGSIGSPTAGR